MRSSLVGSLSVDTLFTASAALEQAVKGQRGELVMARSPEVATAPSDRPVGRDAA